MYYKMTNININYININQNLVAISLSVNQK